MRFVYDMTFRPPAPVLTVDVAHPYTHDSRRTRAKLDTGADIVVIPSDIIRELALESNGLRLSRAFDGRVKHREVYYVDLRVGNLRIRDVRCIAVDRQTALIGRSVLNLFLISLDGPGLQLEVAEL